MGEFSLAQQIEEVERELKLREGVYARRVSAGKMRQSAADYHMNRLKAVRETLQKLFDEQAERDFQVWKDAKAEKEPNAAS